MGENFPSGSDDLNNHPDFRTLAGVDSDSMEPRLAAKVDILRDAKELQALDEVEVGEILRVGFLNPEGENRSLEFLRTDSKSQLPTWLRLDGGFDEDGNFTGEPAIIHGSMPENGGPTAVNSVLEYHRLVYAEPHDEYVQSGEGLSEDHPASGYSHVDTVDPRIVEENLQMDLMTRSDDGTLYWKVPTSRETLVSEPVTTADVIAP